MPEPSTAQIVDIKLDGDCLIEANVRLLAAGHERGRYGVYLDHGAEGRTLVTLAADEPGLLCELERDERESGRHSGPLVLGSGFRSATYHRLLLRVRSGELEVRVDGERVAQVSEAPSTASIGLITRGLGGFRWGERLPVWGELAPNRIWWLEDSTVRSRVSRARRALADNPGPAT